MQERKTKALRCLDDASSLGRMVCGLSLARNHVIVGNGELRKSPSSSRSRLDARSCSARRTLSPRRSWMLGTGRSCARESPTPSRSWVLGVLLLVGVVGRWAHMQCHQLAPLAEF